MPDAPKIDAPAAGAAPDTAPAPETTLEEMANLVMGGMWGNAAPKDEPAAPAAQATPAAPVVTDPKTKPVAKESAEPAAPATPVPAAAPVTPAAPPEPKFSADDIADRVAARLKPAPPVTAPVAPVDPDAGLEEDDRDKLKVLTYMGQQDPKLAGKAQEYRSFLGQEAAYVAKWQKDNPGKEFDGNDTEHEDFYERATPAADEKQMRRWEMDMIAEEKAQKLFTKDRQQREQTSIQDRIASNSKEMQRAVGQEVLAEVAGANIKTLKDLAEDDPMAAEAVYEATGQAQALVGAAEALLTPGTPHKIDPTNWSHQELIHRMLHLPEKRADGTVKLSYEGELAALPREDTDWDMQDGVKRSFVTMDQWNDLTPAQRASRWTLIHHPEIAASFIRRDAKAEVKALVEKKHEAVRKSALKLGFQPGAAKPNTAGDPKPAKGGKPAPTAPASGSPGLGTGALPVTTLNHGATGETSLGELIQKGLYPDIK